MVILFWGGTKYSENNGSAYFHPNHEFKWLCGDNMALFGVAMVWEYDSQSECRIVSLVGFLWWPFTWGSNFLGLFLFVLGWWIVWIKLSLCILKGRTYFQEASEPKRFTLGRKNLVGSGGLRVFGREMKELEEENRQWLQIRVGALSSTVSFVLETLSENWNLISQLQDEVYALRS